MAEQTELEKQIDDYKDRINLALEYYLANEAHPNTQVNDAVRYMVCGKAHRWRPILVTLTSEILGGTFEQALPTACAIEFIHTHTIILDDLPCMDNAYLRRGKEVCHIKYGEAVAILASIHLLNLAFKLTSLRSIQKLLAHSLRRMISGQALDLGYGVTSMTQRQVLKTYALKSGALYACAVQAGAILAGIKARKDLAPLRRYGMHLGVAYQVVDDIYDCEGNTEHLGKNIRMDIGKSTYVSVFGSNTAKVVVRSYRDRALEFISGFDHRLTPLSQIATYIAPIGIEECLQAYRQS